MTLVSVVGDLDTKWSKLSERVRTLIELAVKNYKVREPITKFLESEMLLVKNISAAHVENIRWITQDFDTLISLNKTLVEISPEIEQLVQQGKFLELLSKEDIF